MTRTFLLAALVSVVNLASAAPPAMPSAVTSVDAQERQFISTRHLRDVVRSGEAKAVGRLPSAQVLHFDMLLPPRDPVALEKFLAAVYDPTSPSYRHFVTPAEFTQRFGPSAADWRALVRFAARSGFRVTGGSQDEMDLRLAAPVAAVEAAFHVTMRTYQHPTEARTFYSPDREPTVGLDAEVWHVSGLDDFAPPRVRVHPRAGVTGTPLTSTGGCPGNSYCGSDMRAAYYGAGPLTGAGQSVGLVEFYGYDAADLKTYFTNANQTNAVPVNGVSVGGASTTCLSSQGCDDTEQTLDMTQALGMAPGLAQLNVYVGNTDSAILSAMSVVPPHSVTGKVDAQLSCSWGWGPADPATDDPIFQKFAAQGQSFFTAAGDSGAYTANSQYVYPADDANVTVVGGTDLATTGPGGAWRGESAWADGGGGYLVADNIPLPSWQAAAVAGFNALSGSKASTTLRNSPDVAAEANFDFYVCANQGPCTQNMYGGTSFAAPMWAGYMALVNQQALAGGGTPVGFLNPTLYAIGAGSGYANAFHDVTSGSNGYGAVAGYDLATGWGSPNGAGLIAALTAGAQPGFQLSAAGAVAVGQGASGTVAVSTLASGGFAGTVTLTASGLPNGVSAAFNPATVTGAGSSTLTLQVGASVASGAYPITVTGTSGSLVKTATVTLTVAPAGFTLSSTASVSIGQGRSGTTSISVAALTGFSGPVALGAAGAPAGVTLGITPATLTTAGSAALAIQVAPGAATGSYPITITATSGNYVKTTTTTLTVTAATFALSAGGAVSVPQGGSATAAVAMTVTGGFPDPVTLAASGQPAGVSVAFTPATLTGASSASVALAVGAGVAAGSYPITVTGTSGGVSRTTTVTLVVTTPSFALAAPATLTVAEGATGTFTVSSKGSGGFTGSVTLAAAGQPSGVAVVLPTTLGANASATVSVQVPAGTPSGSFPITLSGTSGALSASATVTLVINPSTFALAASAPAVTLTPGATGAFNVVLTTAGAFTAPISFAAAGVPAGGTAAFSAGSLTGSGTTTLTLGVPVGTASGTYPITITANSGSVTHTLTVPLVVATPAPTQFSLALSTTAITLTHGSSATFGVQASFAQAAATPVTLSLSGLPSGVTAKLSPTAIAGGVTATVTLTAASTAARAPVTLTLIGTSGGVTETSTVSLAVN